MKKLLTLLALLAWTGSAWAQSAQHRVANQLKSVAVDIPGSYAGPVTTAGAGSVRPDAVTTVWSENFSVNPTTNGWLNIGFSGTNNTAVPDTVGVWEYRGSATTPAANQGSRGAYRGSTIAIQSATRSNGFMIFDSDWLDNNGVGGAFGQGLFPSAHRGMLISPMLDMTNNPYLNLVFAQYYRRFGGPASAQSVPATYLLFSRDGGATWSDTMTINADVAVNSATPASNVAASYAAGGVGIKTYNVSQYIGGQDSVKIAFLFDGDYYFWMLDDVRLNTIPGNDLSIVSTVIQPDTSQGRFLQTHRLTEVNKTHNRFQARVRNLGVFPANGVVLTVNVKDSLGNPLFSGTSVPTNLAPFTDSLISISTLYTPTVKVFSYCDYSVYATGVSDEDSSNNVARRQLELTDTIFGTAQTLPTAQGSLGTSSFQGATDLPIANMIEIVSQDTVMSASFRVFQGTSGNPASGPVGSNIYFTIEGNDTAAANAGLPGGLAYVLMETDLYTVTQADYDRGWITVNFPATIGGTAQNLILAPGQYWLVARMFSNAGQNHIRILDDQSVTQPWYTSVINVSNTWYSNGNNFRMPLNLRSGFTPPPCQAPTALAVNSVTNTGASLGWGVVSGASSYEVIVQSAGLGTPTGSGTIVSTNSFNPTGLTPNTSYEYYVRTNCVGGLFSTWSGPSTFLTNCNSVNIPLLENFEPASSTRGCWRSVGAWRLANGASNTTVSASDSVSIWFDFYNVPKNTGGYSLYTPQFAPVPAGTALKFAYAHATYSNTDTDRVVLLTTTDDSTWVSLDTLVGGPNGSMTTAPNSQGPFVPTASQWGAKTYTLPVGTIKVRFQARSDFGNNAYFDNIEIGSTATLTGLLRYNNSASTGLTNSDVRLLAGTAQIASATTGTGGAYTINAVPAGSYTVTGATTKPWGGVTGADALVISRHFSGAVPLVGLRLKAGDVNNNTAVNSQDALLVSRRFAGTVSSFTAGNWSFEALPVNITAGTVTQNILGLCVGDVNGSYSGIPVRSNAPVALLDGGVLASESDELVIPVSAAKAMEIGASSLVFNLPVGLEIVGVDNALPGADFLYNVVNGQLRSVWYHMDGVRLAEGDVLMTIRARRNGALNANLAISNESEIATLWAEALDGAALRVPSLVAKSSTLSLSTYPNPAQDLSVLRFNLNNSARVSAKMTDATGRVVWSQPSAQRNAGQQELMIDTRTLANGVYSVVLTSEVNGEVRVENAKLQVRH
jgi:hypothetical protein